MKRSRLRPISKKRQSDYTKYLQAKTEWREARIKEDGYLQCQFVGKPTGILSPDDDGRCIEEAMQSPHHKKGRHGSLLYNKRYFMACCFFHHNWIEDNKTAARKRKYILYK